MPSKKPNKTAKRPGKAIPKKAARKVAVAKKAARPPANPKPTSATSKVTVKAHKPPPKPAAPKPAAAAHPSRGHAAPAKAEPKPESQKATAEKLGPIKFDARPLVIPTRAAPVDDDADAEQGASASLLAGPRNVKPYIARRGELYMSKEQLEHFARILQNWKRDLMVEVDRTV